MERVIAKPEAESVQADGRVEMTTRDGASGGHHDRDGQPMGERDTQQSGIGVDGADADKDEGECADSLRNARTNLVHDNLLVVGGEPAPLFVARSNKTGAARQGYCRRRGGCGE